jgi:thiamine biosynthesis lipoprotein
MTESMNAQAPRLLAVLFGGIFIFGCSKPIVTEQVFVAGNVTGVVRVAESNYRELAPMTADIANSASRTLAVLHDESPDYELVKLNQVGSSVRIPLSHTVFRIVDMGRYYNTLTTGAYDFTTESVANLWKYGPPRPSALEHAIARSGMKYIETSDNKTAAIIAPGIHISLNHISVPYALDISVGNARRKFAGPALVALGEYARREGRFPNQTPPRVDVRVPVPGGLREIGWIDMSPFNASACLPLPQMIIGPDKRPARVIVDPANGRPASGTRLAAVTGPIATKCYVLAESLLILGIDKGTSILTNFPGYEALIVPDREPLTCHVTPGLKKFFYQTGTPPIAVKDW